MIFEKRKFLWKLFQPNLISPLKENLKRKNLKNLLCSLEQSRGSLGQDKKEKVEEKQFWMSCPS